MASDFLSKGRRVEQIKPIAYLFAIDEVQGAKTSVYLASSPEVGKVSGKYFVKCRQKNPKRFATDEQNAKRL